MHPGMQRKDSLAKGPDYSGKAATLAYLRGEKKVPSEVDYKPASTDSKKRCSECVSYLRVGQAESDCSKVIGIVKGEGTCDLWVQRDYSDDHKPATEITIHVRG